MMIRRLSKKWSALLFILLSVLLAGYGCVNSEAYLLSKHNAITYKEWSKISAEELADALEKGEFNPDQLILRKTDNGLSISPAIAIATNRNQKEHFRLLLDYGANANLIGKFENYEFTALSIVAYKGQTEMMKMLLKAGANPNFISKISKKTPLHSLLSRLGEVMGNEEKVIADEELKNMIALLVEKGADINAIDEDGNSIIHYLTIQCLGNLIKYAAQMGADINHENDTSDTPLLWASMVFRDSIPALLEAGADPNYVLSKGKEETPLSHASIFAPNPTIVIQMLLDGGADINQNMGGISALRNAKLRAEGNSEYYQVYSEMYEIAIVENAPPNCALTRADFANKQSKEEWQRKGQEAVDMLLAHGAKDDANKSVDEDIVAANLTAILSSFQSRVRGIDHVR